MGRANLLLPGGLRLPLAVGAMGFVLTACFGLFFDQGIDLCALHRLPVGLLYADTLSLEGVRALKLGVVPAYQRGAAGKEQ